MHYFDSGSAKLLFETARQMGLKPHFLNDYGLFEITVDGKKFHILQSISILNSQLSGQLSTHKHLTRIILERHNMPNIPFLRTTKNEDVLSFLKQHGKIIAKPVMGSHSEDIHLITEKEHIEGLLLNEYLFEKYISGREVRYVVLNNEVISVAEKVYPGAINDPEKAKRNAYPKKEWDKKLVDLSLNITGILQLHFAAVDFMIDKDGQAFVLEVNSTPGLRRIQYPTSGPGIDIARMFLEATVAMIKSSLK